MWGMGCHRKPNHRPPGKTWPHEAEGLLGKGGQGGVVPVSPTWTPNTDTMWRQGNMEPQWHLVDLPGPRSLCTQRAQQPPRSRECVEGSGGHPCPQITWGMGCLRVPSLCLFPRALFPHPYPLPQGQDWGGGRRVCRPLQVAAFSSPPHCPRPAPGKERSRKPQTPTGWGFICHSINTVAVSR